MRCTSTVKKVSLFLKHAIICETVTVQFNKYFTNQNFLYIDIDTTIEFNEGKALISKTETVNEVSPNTGKNVIAIPSVLP